MRKELFSNPSTMFPLNLQFFAEDNPMSTDDGTDPNPDETGDGGKGDDKPGKTYEDALAEIAAAQAEAKKLKAERDAALKKSGEITKQLRAKMSEDELKAEKDAQEKEEHLAYVKELESFKSKTLAKERYILQGMSAELATKAADAEIKGDMDELAAIQATYTKELIKAKEAEWKASRPRVNMGDDGADSMTREEIMAIKDDSERQRQIAKHLNLFQKA